MISNEALIEGLNDLLEKSIDAEKGFENAASNTESVRLKEYFQGKAAQRRQFSGELQKEISRHGGSIREVEGSTTGTLHRTWMDIKTTLSLNDEEAVLDACETGEKAALEEYDNFLLDNKQIPASTTAVLENHRNTIAKTLRQLDILEEQFDD